MNKTRITSEREFTPELLAAVNHLLPQLTSHATPMTENALRLLLQTEATRLYTIRDEQDRICGMCTLCFTLMPTGKKCWLEDVVVDDACRGKGYAKLLVAEVYEESKRLGAKSLNLTSRPVREAANKLYTGQGFKLRETNVYRRQD